jgi:hypothetical protein
MYQFKYHQCNQNKCQQQDAYEGDVKVPSIDDDINVPQPCFFETKHIVVTLVFLETPHIQSHYKIFMVFYDGR